VFVVLGHYSGGEGYGYALGGFLMVGIVLVVIAGVVKVAGTGWIDVLFPPAAMGALLLLSDLNLFQLQLSWQDGLLLKMLVLIGQWILQVLLLHYLPWLLLLFAG